MTVLNPIVFLNGRVTLHVGDCLSVLKAMPGESVDCVVTSPPYWGLRDYGVAGQIGLEPTLAEHIDKIVEVFEEIKRVLKTTGTVWMNYGDSYASKPNGTAAADYKAKNKDDRTFGDKPFSTVQGFLKPKDLCMLPNRIAIALQEAGWWIRSEIIWAKPNPMPESARDRPFSAHEKIFLMTKCLHYEYDQDAVTQPVSKNTHARLSQDVMAQIESSRANGGQKTNGNMKAVIRKQKNLKRGRPHSLHKNRIKDNESFDSALALPVIERNLRNYEPAPLVVWRFSTAAFKDAHFATFPPELAERCILAGCPKDGVVFDPFGGAGTTALVAARYGRLSELIELNPEYAEISKNRIQKEWRHDPKPVPIRADMDGTLFEGFVE